MKATLLKKNKIKKITENKTPPLNLLLSPNQNLCLKKKNQPKNPFLLVKMNILTLNKTIKLMDNSKLIIYGKNIKEPL